MMLTPQLVIDVFSLHLTLSKVSNFYFFNVQENPFYEEWWFLIVISVVSLSLSYFLFFKLSRFNQDLIKNYTEIDFSQDQIRFFMLFLGIFLPVVESILEFYKVRLDSKLIQNTSIGLFLLLIYFLSGKVPFIYKQLKNIFVF